MMPTLIDTIELLGASFVITQGRYDLTADSLRTRGERPLHCGDDYVFSFTLLDEDDDPVSLTGDTLTFTAKYAVNGSTIVTVVAVLDADPTTGKFTVTIADTAVAGPERIVGIYDIQRLHGTEKSTLIYGDIEFLPNVTA